MAQKKKSSGIGYFAVIILVIVGLFVYDGITSTDTAFDESSWGDDDTEIRKNIYLSDDINKYEFYYLQLNDNEKMLYDSIKSAVSTGNTSCKVENYEEKGLRNSVSQVIDAFHNDHPEYFWINGGASYTWNSTSGGKCDLKLELKCYQYWDHSFDPGKYLSELNREVNYVSELAKEYPTTYEKVLFVHDYLVRTADYDHKGLEEAKKTVHDAKSEFIYSAYGCLINKDTVCAGYAKAFQLVLNNLGIECAYITGYAGEGHAWNMVNIDGELCYIDVTWNDSSPNDKNGVPLYPDEATYSYFGITTEELQTTHVINKDYFEIPVCTSMANNYYTRQGFFVDSYDVEKIENIIKSQPNRNVISMKFASQLDLENTVDNLRKFVSVPKPMKVKSYNSNVDMCVLTLYAE